MSNNLLKCALGIGAAALIFVQPAQAASCWNQQEAAAAKVRDLQSRLMVATMRCKAMGIDVLTAYNDFVRVNRSTIQAANGVIKAQFTHEHGGQGQAFYDRFTTALANEYGGEATSKEICKATADAAGEAVAAGGNVDRLLTIAGRLGASPKLPGGQCGITFTSLE